MRYVRMLTNALLGCLLGAAFVMIEEAALRISAWVRRAHQFHDRAEIGLGLIQVPRYHAEKDLASGALVHVLSDFPLTQTPVSLLYPRNRQLSHSRLVLPSVPGSEFEKCITQRGFSQRWRPSV